MKSIVFRSLCRACMLCLLLAGPRLALAAEPRIALVVGNASYEDSALANPVNDAGDMAKELKRLGFTVTLRTNQNADQLKELISDFGDQLARSKGVGLFYFAGHGVQVDGRNYLLPVGRRYRREKDVELFAVESRAVLARMEEAGNPLNIVILDACRNSPLPPESRSADSRGLARDSAPSGALIAYATAPGRTADDRPGARNGLYTGHLLQALREPGLRLEDVFGRVREAVELDSTRSRSGVRQSPEEVSRLRGKPFYFMPPVASAGGAPFVTTPVAPPAPPVPQLGDTFRDCAECPEMVVLPAGHSTRHAAPPRHPCPPGEPRRWLEQHREEHPFRPPQQEHTRQPEQQSGVPAFEDASTAGGAATRVAARAHGSVQVARRASGGRPGHVARARSGCPVFCRGQERRPRLSVLRARLRAVAHPSRDIGRRGGGAAPLRRPDTPLPVSARATRLRGVRTPIRRQRR